MLQLLDVALYLELKEIVLVSELLVPVQFEVYVVQMLLPDTPLVILNRHLSVVFQAIPKRTFAHDLRILDQTSGKFSRVLPLSFPNLERSCSKNLRLRSFGGWLFFSVRHLIVKLLPVLLDPGVDLALDPHALPIRTNVFELGEELALEDQKHLVLLDYFLFLAVSGEQLLPLELLADSKIGSGHLGSPEPAIVLHYTADIVFKLYVLALLETLGVLRRQVVDEIQIALVVDRVVLRVHLARLLFLLIALIVMIDVQNLIVYSLGQVAILVSHF